MSLKKAPPPKESRMIFNTLLDQYLYQGLPVDSIDEKTAFTTQNPAAGSVCGV